MKRRFTILSAALALLVCLAFPMGMWGQTTDVINHDATSSNLGNTNTSTWATNFSITGTSGAVYYIHSMGTKSTNNALQFNKNGFLYMTGTSSSGEKLKSITINGTSGKSLYIYAQNAAFTAEPTNTSSAITTMSLTGSASTYTFTSNYTYLAIHGKDSSTSIVSVTIEWESSSTPIPSLSVSPSSIDFGSNAINPENPYTETFNVTFANLTQNLTVTGFSGVTVSPSTISANATSPKTVTVSYNPTTAGSISGNISVNSSEVTEQLVAVTGSAYDPDDANYYEKVSSVLSNWSGDYIFTGINSSNYYALTGISNNIGTAAAVTVTDNGIVSTPTTDSYKVTIAATANGYSLYLTGAGYLSYSGSSNNLYVSETYSESSCEWTLSFANGVATITNVGVTSRILQFNYNNGNPRFACYGNSNQTKITLFKYVNANQVAMPTFSPEGGNYFETQSVALNCATDGATIYYTTDGTTPSASNGTAYTSAISVSETMTIKAIAIKSGMTDSDVATATYTIEQPYSTIPALFAAATSTEQDVRVTFNNWVVSGVSTNGKNVFVTDNNGNGFVIYYNSDMSSTYAAGDILSGSAVSCTLKKHNGFAELLNVDATDLIITTGGIVSTSNIAMASLAGVNTGALVHYDNLICEVTTNSEGTSTYYYLTDGTTSIQVYNSLYAFGALENGASYNITGVYQQFNSIKEILPRSVNDIEYVLPAPLYTVTLCDDQTALTEESYGAGVTLPSRTDASGTYTFAGWSTTNVGGTETTTAPTIIPVGEYHPTQNIILYPVYTRTEGSGSTTTEWHFTDLADVNVGVYAILSANNYAFNGTITEENAYGGHGLATSAPFAFVNGIASSSPEGTLEITFEAVEENGSVVGYKLHDVNGNRYLYASDATAKHLSWHTTEDNYWRYDYSDENKNLIYSYSYNGQYAHLRSYTSNNGDTFRTYANNSGNQINLAKKVEVASGTTYYTSLLATYELPISSYSTGGYRLIASPIGTVNPGNVTNMLTQKDGDNNTYDLYAFDQDPEDGSGKEWRNYRATNDGFDLEFGHGYLYGNINEVELVFTGNAYNGDGKVTLSKADVGEGLDFPGWNLVGNPFATEIVEIKDDNSNTLNFYTMHANGRQIVATTNTTIQPMEGVFVIADEDGEEITFTPVTEGSKGSLTALNLSNGNEFVDRAIVRFGQGRQLPKLQLDRNSSKLYIPQNGHDYAVVYSEEMGAMPVNFKAENNGTYNLSLNSENVEFAYLHLIDNMTGNDVDLLKTPSYSFEAKTTDYESRFKLVFATGDNSNDDTFAFYSNGSFVINNEGNATLQMIDITGRIVKSESVNGCANVNVNAAPGVYMLRLINGDNVKTQKVVVK